LNDDDMINK